MQTEQESTKEDTPNNQNKGPQATQNIDLDLSQFNDEFQLLQSPMFSTIYSHFICHKTSRVVINTSDGFAIVEENKLKKYYAEGPFMGKAGVRTSCLLSNRNLIALVPDRDIIINSEDLGRVQLSMSSVYIFDINIDSVIYQKNFNNQIKYLHFTQKYILAGNNKRIIAIDYIKQKSQKKELDQLIKQYQDKNARMHLTYIQTGCDCEILSLNCQCGKIKASVNEPQIVAYTFKNKKKLGIFLTELDYHYELQTDAYQDFCLSHDGKYLALAGVGGNYVRIINVSTREVYTQFRRGFQSKRPLCLGFIDGWFGIVYQSKQYATLHIFQMRTKKQNEVIHSKFKRYFSTYSSSIDFMVYNKKIIIISLIGGYLEVIGLQKLSEIHVQHIKSIKYHDIQMWST